jgi:Integrase core domain
MRCSPTTVTGTYRRWLQASETERASGAWCAPRRPVPRSCPWALGAREEQRILDARARTNWGPMRLAALVGHHRATVWKVLKRHGVSRRRRGTRQTFRRFEWRQPGALLHIDAYNAPKFASPGHRTDGDRTKIGRPGGLGKTVVIAVHDDHTRLVYAELHSAENATNVAITLTRGARCFREQGCGPLEAVMSDNAFAYTQGPKFAAALAALGARHIRIPPYTPLERQA